MHMVGNPGERVVQTFAKILERGSMLFGLLYFLINFWGSFLYPLTPLPVCIYVRMRPRKDGLIMSLLRNWYLKHFLISFSELLNISIYQKIYFHTFCKRKVHWKKGFWTKAKDKNENRNENKNENKLTSNLFALVSGYIRKGYCLTFCQWKVNIQEWDIKVNNAMVSR